MRENGEWRVIGNRGRVVNQTSERQPIRKLNYRNPGSNPNLQKNLKITGCQVIRWSTGAKRGVPNPSGNEYWNLEDGDNFSFIFKNFPEDYYLDTLVNKFSSIGEVTDIFCPSKRDREGKLSSFVRFNKEVEEKKLLENLNGIWIGSYKIRAFIPRFKREKVFKMSRSEFPGLSKETVDKVEHKIIIVGDQTFAEMVQNTERSSKKGELKEVEVNFESAECDREWVKKCYTGFLKKEFPWEDHAEELLGECGGNMSLKSIGGNLILLQSTSDKSMRELIEDFDEWVAYWFDWVRPWNNLDVNLNRSIWTRWHGLQLHAWSVKFFAIACAKFGLFIKMEDVKEQKYSLEFARVQIYTSCLQSFNKVMQVRIDGLTYSIRVVEESEYSCSQFKTRMVSSDEELDSNWGRRSLVLKVRRRPLPMTTMTFQILQMLRGREMKSS